MKYKIFIFAFLFYFQSAIPQILTWSPLFSTPDDTITIVYDATEGTRGLVGASEVYAHTGVITEKSNNPSDWRYVKTAWGQNTPETRLDPLGNDQWQIRFHIRSYYGVPVTEKILQLAFVFRNAACTREGKDVGNKDIFLPVYEEGLNVAFLMPTPIFPELNDSTEIIAAGSRSVSLKLFIDNELKHTVNKDTLKYTITATEYVKKRLKITAVDSTGAEKSLSTYYIVREPVNIAALPDNVIDGINEINETTVTLVLHAPFKEFIYVIGDFNDFEADPLYYMNKTPDGERWWFTLRNLEPDREVLFQYYVDGKLKIADPYTDKIIDPVYDPLIPEETYPTLTPYPADQTTDIVSTLQTAQQDYNWEITDFQKPPKEQLVIYELLIRDFIKEHNYQTLIDTLDYLQNLGINAVELMPINEFEGNSSWGYNPSFYFAPDKYYGPKNDLKKFIDAAHKRGIAVIQDIVLNHAYGQCSLVQLYAGDLSESPWFNVTSPNPTYYWGFDFNHDRPATRDFVDRVLKYWVEEYHIDGFRLDFTKGFTQTPGEGWYYDESRINNLKRIADRVWETDPETFLILEHLTVNTEEKELADYGMMLWGKMTEQYNEATMGYHDNDKSDLSWGWYKRRGWAEPNLVTYMESHDEERLMVKNLQWGNSSGDYNIKDLSTALDRMKMAAAFFFTIPGPKMIWQFGELGYDYSIDYNGRVGEKPIRWDYFQMQERRALYDVFAALIKLKTRHDAFNSQNVILSTVGATKKIKIEHETMNVVILGNFGVTPQNIMPNYYHDGAWYDYFSGDSINVTDPSALVSYLPGEFHIYTDVRLEKPHITGLRDELISGKPAQFRLAQNYPNPFNPSTTIQYELPEPSYVTLNIYNIAGQKVITLVDAAQKAGSYRVSWNGLDLSGRAVSAGVYFVRISTKNYSATKKMVLVR
ncbi:T9SS type A sorting domain-containing protein [candidate division KSB1 bacterium]|nr:T9SS type A sorting domain-containing protein [candidate division KSB1 bacterium]